MAFANPGKVSSAKDRSVAPIMASGIVKQTVRPASPTAELKGTEPHFKATRIAASDTKQTSTAPTAQFAT
jgi:hypothetical protein